MKARTAILRAGLIVFWGCGGESPPPDISVRDSLGIRILEMDHDQPSVHWSVAHDPEWILGDDARDGLVFHGIVDATFVGDGVIAVVESSTQQVVTVDLQSGTVRGWGGDGDGPGEFRGVARVFPAEGEGVGVYDRQRRRYVEFDGDGDLVREVGLPVVGEARDELILEVVRDGVEAEHLYLAARTTFPSEPVEGPYRGSGPIVRLGDQSEVDTLTTIRGITTFVGGGFSGLVPFGATTLIAGSSSGIWIGDTAEQEVSLWAASGDREVILRWHTSEPRGLTRRRVDQLWERLEAGTPEQQRDMVAQVREVTPVPDSVPGFGSLAVSPTGNVWIGSFVPPESQMLEVPPPAQEWRVMDWDAEWVGRTSTPAGFRVLRVGDGFLLGVHLNELGVETLRRYELELMGDQEP